VIRACVNERSHACRWHAAGLGIALGAVLAALAVR
jgi:hypothetical protein